MNTGTPWARALERIKFPTYFKGLLTAIAVVVIAFSYYFVTNEAQQQATARAQENLRAVTFALAQHIEQTLEQADQISRVMRRSYVEGGNYRDLTRSIYRELDPILYPQLGFINNKGLYVFGTLPDFKPIDLGDRKHFRIHADTTGEDALYVSTPLLGRASKKLTLQLTRRMDAANGDFMGVTVVSINPEQFTSVYRKLIGKDGLITLSGFDGINRIRVDTSGFAFGQDLNNTPWFKTVISKDHGFIDIVSAVDGKHRLTAFQQLPSRRLFVTVGQPYDEIAANYLPSYHRYLPWLTGFLILTLLTLFGLSVRTQNLNRRLNIANAALSNSMSVAFDAVEAKNRFLASVSHELRTPLHGILGHSELLSLEELPVDAQESATSIFRSASHLLQIVNQLLDISKADSGNQEMKIEPVGLRAAIEEMMTLHIVTANRTGTTLTLDIATNVPEQVNTDATALKRVMHNLIANALKFTKAGAVKIRVGATASHIRFEVSDTGIGISPENQRRLFTNYTQVHDFETRETPGTGLGLALARSLVELLGGNIGVESLLGQGSTFWFTIPRENTTMSATKAPL